MGEQQHRQQGQAEGRRDDIDQELAGEARQAKAQDEKDDGGLLEKGKDMAGDLKERVGGMFDDEDEETRADREADRAPQPGLTPDR